MGCFGRRGAVAAIVTLVLSAGAGPFLGVRGVVASAATSRPSAVPPPPVGPAPPAAARVAPAPAAAALTAPPVSLPAVDRGARFYLGVGMSGTSGLNFVYGNPTDVPLMCDWSGDGTSSAGVFRHGIWYIRYHLGAGPPDASFAFGNAGDVPVCGDWTGSGRAGPGVFRNGTWYFRVSLTSGSADGAINFGNAGDRPVVGRWTGGIASTPGVVRRGVWYLRTTLSSGASDIAPLTFGNPTDVPVVGDWTGAGRDAPGVVRSGVWYLRNTVTSGGADSSFAFGNAGDIPLTWSSGGYVWGVDTTDNVQTSDDINQTRQTLGNPTFVGRYIVFGGGVLGGTEAQYIHSQGLKILPIVDPPNGDLTAGGTGAAEAAQGIAAARALGIPAGTALFRDIESSYATDAAWIQAWVNGFQGSGYVPGVYENPLTGSSSFAASYCAAVGQSPDVAGKLVLWSDEPEHAGADPSQAAMPAWAAARPNCANTTVAWQYLIHGAFSPGQVAPNVDVDQFAARFTGLLW